jgi:hypothetical protein
LTHIRQKPLYIDQRLQQRIPYTLFDPPAEPNIDRVPLAVSLVHVAPGAADPQNMQHADKKAPIVARRPRPEPRSGGNSGPITSRSAPTNSRDP